MLKLMKTKPNDVSNFKTLNDIIIQQDYLKNNL